jgi:hypothetical protein
MSTEKKPTNFKISPWWIYSGLIAVFLILSLLNGGNFNDPQIIKSSESDALLNKGQVEKIIIFNKLQAEIYLTPAALKDKANKKVAKDLLDILPMLEMLKTTKRS